MKISEVRGVNDHNVGELIELNVIKEKIFDRCDYIVKDTDARYKIYLYIGNPNGSVRYARAFLYSDYISDQGDYPIAGVGMYFPENISRPKIYHKVVDISMQIKDDLKGSESRPRLVTLFKLHMNDLSDLI